MNFNDVDSLTSDTPEGFWQEVRATYPRQEPLLNLNNAAVSPPPLEVEQAVVEAYRLISRNPDVNMWSKLDAALPDIKAELAQLIDCAPTEIALNRNSSEGLATAIFGIPLQPGDEVLISPWDYPSARAGWLQRREREGIEPVVCQFGLLDDDAAIIEAYSRAITPRTRVMLLTHMYHWNGRLLPVERLCALAREHGIVTVVDGAQTFAQMPVNFRNLGCDIFITSLHKWLGAPVGNGMLVVREGLIDDTWPLLAPFDPPPLRIDKFDHWNLGTYNSAIQAGIMPAIRLHRRIGVERIQRRLSELTRYWIERARDIPGFRLHTPLTAGPLDAGPLGAVALFSIDSVDSRLLERVLREQHRVHVKYRRVEDIAGLRVSPHIYMRKDELDVFVDALQATVRSCGARASR
ncbi:aminotransferase class V-fold PLP-dependent enzyme [Mesorhizobium sp.]|uniref:aminotransferase class V-fold PLP-dependent enzyme n=1 Tax=Mesorhizobium sp. TaxID=1871066 RepID=UPI000FE66B87|nr:aminotransferase class V-fold PLP-dependent enzyme [Mesorhizobium sp.]RWM70894.1 MAG: aminotransferase class V-fold PLP-dependent enzyme [Mesorhizobium sp.]TIO26796.1 MAG: aminotransferase class V-fold PLP-dependent enzyme [Mesorhizobium sp.]TJV60232.1 MAG: aminotransferase class V-fold PLP-dependent enzyme [Mesorhizobium sp.]